MTITIRLTKIEIEMLKELEKQDKRYKKGLEDKVRGRNPERSLVLVLKRSLDLKVFQVIFLIPPSAHNPPRCIREGLPLR